MLDLLLSHVSYAGVFIALVLTGCGLPIPEELIVIAAGWASATGVLHDPWLALAVCIAGALLGDMVMYAIGYHFGYRVLRHRIIFGRSPAARLQREEQAERMIEKHGLKALFIARFLVGLRSMVYLSAGIMRMPFRKFLLADAISATTLVGLVFGLSYRYAWGIESLWRWIRRAEATFTTIIVAAVIIGVLVAWRRHRMRVARVERRRLERSRQRAAILASSGGADSIARRSEPAA